MENIFLGILGYIALSGMFFSLGYTWARIDNILKEMNNAKEAK